MTIIETCSAVSSRPFASLDVTSEACVSDPLHAVMGSWLGLVVQPASGPGGPAPQLPAVVRCEDLRWG
ncbi:MAG: hypothetical protein H6712_05305 [Myxococcales bacterium]|nr:hypothetical protein [Myxococcales bacterium]MCB9713250.1 hypothetical protein [Myxococcales bacterium]